MSDPKGLGKCRASEARESMGEGMVPSPGRADVDTKLNLEALGKCFLEKSLDLTKQIRRSIIF